MARDLPKPYRKFIESNPEIADAYNQLGDVTHKAGPLDDKTRSLIKCALSGGARMQGAFHAHVRKAIKAGASKEELRHIAFLCLPTLGFPHMMTLLTWIDDEFED